MDIGLALTYVTRDPQWLKKVLIGGLIMLVSIPLSIVLVGFLGFFIVGGYGIAVTRNVIQGTEYPLPEWTDFGAFLTSGFKAFVGYMVWALPLIVLSVCNQLFGSTSDEAGALSLLVSLCLLTPLNLILGNVIGPTINGRFAVSGEISSMLQVSEIVAQIRATGFVPYLLFFVLSIIAAFLTFFGLIICLIGIVFTGIYATMSLAHATGQLYLQHQSNQGVTPATPHPAF